MAGNIKAEPGGDTRKTHYYSGTAGFVKYLDRHFQRFDFESTPDPLQRTMAWLQYNLKLPARTRGFHLITREVAEALPELHRIKTGLLHVFIQHTSASVAINENADPDVPTDLERSFSALAPEDFPYRHTIEGPDDMPAHVKAALLGSSVCVPIREGRLALGTWQGIYLCEHRNRASGRNLVLTLHGEFAQ